MTFDNFSDFLEMGRHGIYVWSAYGFSVFVLGGLIVNTLVSRRTVRKKLRKRLLRV